MVIYDCDGVIFDSQEAVLAYYDYVCETFNISKIDRTDANAVSMAMMKTNEEILNLLTKDQTLVAEMLEFAKNMNFKKFLDHMILEPDMVNTLEALTEKGIVNTIFTNRGHSLHYLLEHFELACYFSYRVTSFDVEKPKPSAEGLYKILSHFNLSKEDVLYIGDSNNDYFAAVEANVDFIAYKNKLGDSPIIHNHMEILNYLK